MSKAAATFLRRHREVVRALVPAGRRAGSSSRRWTRLPGSIATSARPSACWITWSRVPATDRLAASGCRGRFSRRPSHAPAVEPSMSTRSRWSPPTSTMARRRTRPKRPGARDAAAPRLRRHDRRRARLHRPRARRQRHDDGPGRHRPVRDAARPCARREARGAVEGRAGHPHRRPAHGSRRAPDSAAAPSRGRRSRALRRQGPASSRADPDRRHPDRDARALVPAPDAPGPKCRPGGRSLYPVKALAIVRVRRS